MSSEALRVADDDIRAVLADSPDWRVARRASTADVVLRVEIEFWREGPLRNVGGTVWTRRPTKSEETLLSQSATTYDPNVGGPGPQPDFWKNLLSPLLTVVPERCARSNDWTGNVEKANRAPPQNVLDWLRHDWRP